MDWISFFKALHIIGWVAWFGGFFYLGRIFVYHREAQDLPANERDVLVPQFTLMINRAYNIILKQAMIITWVSGIAMLVFHVHYSGMEWLKVNGWMHVKLVFLFLLMGFHVWCKKTVKRLEAGEKPYDSFQFRLLNEMPTLFLTVIVFIAVYKNATNYLYLFLGLLAFAGLMYWGASAYKRRREKEEKNS